MLSPWTVGRIVDTAASVEAGYQAAFLLTAALLAATGLLAVWRLRPERDGRRLADGASDPQPAPSVVLPGS